MDEIFKKQQAEIINLLKIDRILQVSQSLDSKHISNDEDSVLEKLDQIHETVKKIESKNVQYDEKQNSFDIDSRKNTNLAAKENIEQLKKIQEAISHRNIADKAINEPIFKSFSDKFKDIGKTFESISSTLTSGNLLRNAGRNIGSAISPRYKDQLEYIRAERNLGNVDKTDKELKTAYEERSQLLQRNVANEEMLKRAKGKLTPTEFLKGGSKVAERYVAEKTAIGEGLKARDTRYTIDEKVREKKQKETVVPEVDTEPKKYSYPKKRFEFEKDTSSIKEQVTKKANAIPVMATANKAPSQPKVVAPEATAPAPIQPKTAIPEAPAPIQPKTAIPEAPAPIQPKVEAILPNTQPTEIFKTELSAESKVESATDTKNYQDSQLDNVLEQTSVIKEQLDNDLIQTNVIKEQTDILKNQLETQNKILEAITKDITKTSDGTGIDNIIDSVGDRSKKKDGKKLGKIGNFFKKHKASLIKGGLGIAGGMAMEAGGDALKEAGHEDLGNVVSTAGSAAEGAGTGAMLGSVLGLPGEIIGAGAGAIVGAAEGFSDTFGEGGFDLIQKLRDKDAISYGLGTTTPTVDKWDVIEKLPKEDIQTLINTNEFEGKDLQHLEKLLEPSKETTKVSKATSDTDLTISLGNKPISTEPAKVVTKEGVSINQEGWDNKPSELVEPIRQRAEPISQTDDKKTEFKQALKTETDRIFAENLKKEPEEWQNDVDVRNEVRSEAELQAKVNLKERGINPYDLINDKGEVQRVGAKQQEAVKNTLSDSLKVSPAPTAITPEIKPPSIGNSVYEESYNNSSLKGRGEQGASIINAPSNVVNTTNNTQNSIVKAPTRNADNTILEYLKSRYA